jgi:hypothetical protein
MGNKAASGTNTGTLRSYCTDIVGLDIYKPYEVKPRFRSRRAWPRNKMRAWAMYDNKRWQDRPLMPKTDEINLELVTHISPDRVRIHDGQIKYERKI